MFGRSYGSSHVFRIQVPRAPAWDTQKDPWWRIGCGAPLIARLGQGVQSGYATSLGSTGDGTLHQHNSWEDHWETLLVSQPVLLCKPPARHLWEERVWCENPAVRGRRRGGLAEPSGLLVACESWLFSLKKKQQCSREGTEISNLCNFQILGQNYFLICEETVGKDVLLWYSCFIQVTQADFQTKVIGNTLNIGRGVCVFVVYFIYNLF